MHTGKAGVPELFAQLGLPTTEEAIATFITRHRLDTLDCALADAPAWTPSQASFLREAIAADDEWALAAEWLTEALRRSVP